MINTYRSKKYLFNGQYIHKQENIPVGYIQPTWKPHILQFQLPPPNVTPEDPQINKFEQVSSDHHKTSLVGGSPGLMLGGGTHLTFPGDGWSAKPCDLYHDEFNVTYPPPPMTDTCENITFRNFVCWR